MRSDLHNEATLGKLYLLFTLQGLHKNTYTSSRHVMCACPLSYAISSVSSLNDKRALHALLHRKVWNLH